MIGTENPLIEPETIMAELEAVMLKDALAIVPLPRYDGFAVSRVARIYSVTLGALTEIPQFLGRGGYLEVGLPGRSMSVHRLVASAFLPPPLPHQIVVRHLDGTRLNNHPSNLAWGTYQDNANDWMAIGGSVTRGEANVHAKLTEASVLEIREAVLTRGERPGAMARRFGVSAALVSMVVRGDIWKHVGGPTKASIRTMALRTHNAKLTDDDVAEIRRAKAAGATSKDLGKKYNVTYYHINAICNGQWRGPKPSAQGEEK